MNENEFNKRVEKFATALRDLYQLRLRGGGCSGESFGHISVIGENNHCCNYDLCDDCVKQFFDFMHDTSKIVGGESDI